MRFLLPENAGRRKYSAHETVFLDEPAGWVDGLNTDLCRATYTPIEREVERRQGYNEYLHVSLAPLQLIIRLNKLTREN